VQEGGVSALATAPLFTAPTVVEEAPRGGALTLEERLELELGAALSRRWERTADRYSLQLTGDRDAYIQTHLALARSNLADLDPPRLAYLTLFTHPTPPERLTLVNSA